MANTPSFDPLAWALGALGTISLGWVGFTSRQTQKNATDIAVLQANYANIKEGIDEIKEHLGVPRKEE